MWLWSFLFFFFKQKTAYEMRISDWSSDVCSSDLAWPEACPMAVGICPASHLAAREQQGLQASPPDQHGDRFRCCEARRGPATARPYVCHRSPPMYGRHSCGVTHAASPRSEEHTSELQSLMRISYAVFCLKHKNT